MMLRPIKKFMALFITSAAMQRGKLCPAGWHVPDYDELYDTGGNAEDGIYRGGELKEIGTSHWAYPNADVSNSTGWTALPGGMRIPLGLFYYIGLNGYWLIAEDGSASLSKTDNGLVYGQGPLQNGYAMSVGCIKEN